MIYTCIKCNKTFKQKSNYDYHINRKRPCINKIYNQIDLSQHNNILSTKITPNCTNITPKNTKLHQILQKIEDYKTSEKSVCKYCNKHFTRNSSLTRHFERCKLKKMIDEENNNKDKLIELLLQEKEENKKQNEELRTEIEELKNIIIKSQNKRSNIMNHSNIASHNNIRQTNNFVVKFGNEDVNLLTH